jgi:death-on-curing protein
MHRGVPIWIDARLAQSVHARQLAEHGGLDGVRDPGLLDSALARPRQLFAHSDPSADLAAMAAAYAYGIARNHPFVDGNKRTAAVVCETFLNLNGGNLDATDAEMVLIFLDLAAGSLSESDLADWIREHLKA